MIWLLVWLLAALAVAGWWAFAFTLAKLRLSEEWASELLKIHQAIDGRSGEVLVEAMLKRARFVRDNRLSKQSANNRGEGIT